ncbi:MAG: hypothetical protein QOJ96_3986 [Alphaproteobacteria bacterium]|jgi:hypothetical protein|nr:hypothetical protein [Alphaproteobacteria bacterium]
MKQIGIMAATLILAAAPFASAAFAQEKSVKDQLVGSWALVSNTVGEGDKKVEPYGPNPPGSAFYAANGRFSVIIVRAGVPKFASNNRETGTDAENKAATQGAIAYFGTYTVDDKGELTSQIESSTYPNFVGQQQKRMIAIKGNELQVTNPNPSAGGGASLQIWRRVP